ncbi:MAG: hypothetical protein IPO67_13355 [Deltaproteobacteria bacterium]|nr:hypothetical protein [Deltaproteobacteria bacterium]
MKFRSDALHLLILLSFTPLLACAGGPGGTKDAADDTAADDTAVDTAPPTEEEQTAADLKTVEAMIAGELGLTDGMLTVSLSGGWPIHLGGDDYLFAAPAQGRERLAVAGDFNGWTPADMALEGPLFTLTVSIPAPEGQLYKLVEGEVYAADPWSRAYGQDEFGEHSIVRGAGRHLERYYIRGGALDDRWMRVWVPAGEVTHTLYVHDGQNLFDPEAMWGGWRLQESLGPNTMAVGLDNTMARMDEYTHVQDFIYGEWMGGKGDAYAELWMSAVRPLIREQYGEADTVGMMGSSLGGLISVHFAQLHPEELDFVASLSGTLGWGSIGAENETLIQRVAAGGFTGVPIYLDSGGEPGEGCIDTDKDGLLDDAPDSSDNYCETRQMADTLAAAGWTWDTDLWHWWEPGAEHNEAAWADRVNLPVGLFESL